MIRRHVGFFRFDAPSTPPSIVLPTVEARPEISRSRPKEREPDAQLEAHRKRRTVNPVNRPPPSA